MRIGIMGGTFDPVHNGHLEIAQAVRCAWPLDGLMLLPAGDPPHKKRESNRFDRWEMTRLAASEQDDMIASNLEVSREGATYTVDTLTLLHQQQPDVEWVYIIGADTVHALETWRDFPKVAQLCSFAAVGRPGYDEAFVQSQIDHLRQQFGVKVRLLDVSGPDISSTDIRRRVAEGRSIHELVPASVEAYIENVGLYLCAYTWQEMESMLQKRLTLHRFQHTLSVAATAVRLSKLYGISPQRARMAGLLHDCAKSMPYPEMVARVRAELPDVDESELALEPVLHAPAGMLVARDEFGVRDAEVLSAIRLHTLGGANMTPLEKLIYVADFIEPNRRPFPGLDDVRHLAEVNLDAAARRCAELSSEFIIRRGGKLNRRTAEMLRK